jgi:hypothetical protein
VTPITRPTSKLAAIFAAATVTLGACGSGTESTSTPAPPRVTYSAHGVAVMLPTGWQHARATLTPYLGDPRQVLAVGTFPLRYRQTGCAHVPGSALEDLGPRDAFVELEERGRVTGSDRQEFPPRPARFGPKLGTPSEASECVPKANFTERWIAFTDASRYFYARVAFGPKTAADERDQTWSILDSLKVDPTVRPRWGKGERGLRGPTGWTKSG